MSSDLSVYSLFIAILVVAGFLFIALVALLRQMRLRKIAASAIGKLNRLNAQVESYRSSDRYLKKRDKIDIVTELSGISSALQRLLLSPNGWFFSSAEKASIESALGKTQDVISFLESSYVREYVTRMASRYADIVRRGNLDLQQTEAVFKDDSNNLVIAAAGSGKTSALAARIAFLTESGVPRKKILALAYTNSAGNEMRDRLEREIRPLPDGDKDNSFCGARNRKTISEIQTWGCQRGTPARVHSQFNCETVKESRLCKVASTVCGRISK